MKKIVVVVIAIISFIGVACTQNRTYLTDLDKAWNPYKQGQVLIFGSSAGEVDTIEIQRIEDNRFPDGLGAPKNERLRILARLGKQSKSNVKQEVRLLYISARTATEPSRIDFEFSIGGSDFWGKYFNIHELEEYKKEYLELPNMTFNDVIRIDDNSNQRLRPYDIATIYWSKSSGYVKCEEKDGTVWELMNIVDSPK